MAQFSIPTTEYQSYRKNPNWKHLKKHRDPIDGCVALYAELMAVSGHAHSTEHERRIAKSQAVTVWFETFWWKHQRPFYNLWPSVQQLVEDTTLDIPMKSLELPFPSLSICFSDKEKQIAFANISVVDQSLCDDAVFRLTKPHLFCIRVESKSGHVIWRCGQIGNNDDVSVMASTSDREAFREHSLTTAPGRSTKKDDHLLNRVVHIYAGVCIMANDPKFVTPIVLNKDKLRYQDADEATKEYLEQRAARVSGRGFSVGEDLESNLSETEPASPHFRRPHMALFWTGKGRSTPVLKLRRGAVVKPKEMLSVPTGFLGASEQEKTSASSS